MAKTYPQADGFLGSISKLEAKSCAKENEEKLKSSAKKMIFLT